MSDIAFLDTETMGLEPWAPIWEFAAIRRTPNPMGWTEAELHLFIDHDRFWLYDMPEQFRADLDARFDYNTAVTPLAAAYDIADFLKGAHVIACNPAFDDPRIARLLRSAGLSPTWHYHPDDISSMVKGYLAARGELPLPPWKSDQLSRAVGVDPDDYDRHTAMGDCLWVRAQWDKVMRGAQ